MQPEENNGQEEPKLETEIKEVVEEQAEPVDNGLVEAEPVGNGPAVTEAGPADTEVKVEVKPANTEPKAEEKPAETKPLNEAPISENKPKKNHGMLYGMILLAIIAIGGIGFGVWAMMDRDATTARLEKEIASLKKQLSEQISVEEDETRETGNWYGKPTSVDRIQHIAISFDGGRKNISIGNLVEYYTSDDSDFEGAEVDSSEIKNYVFDNDLMYLTEYAVDYDADWSIAVNGPGMTCGLSGDGEYPEWFKTLLKKFDIDVSDLQ